MLCPLTVLRWLGPLTPDGDSAASRQWIAKARAARNSFKRNMHAITVKELVVVLCISTAVFHFARPITSLFMSEEDFGRRRKAWYALTCAFFLAPNFWIFSLIAALVLIFAAKKDSNPVALYLLVLRATPPAAEPVPMIGMSFLFNLDMNLLLSFCILVPTAWRLMRSAPDVHHRRLKVLDLSLAAYGILTSILYVRLQDSSGALYPITFTDCLRRAFVFFFAVFVPYYVISRSTARRAALTEALAAFCLSGALMAATAIFESLRHWLLYAEVPGFWGITATTYIMRGDSIRAMASTGHPLSLGYLLAIAFGFWLFLQSNVASARRRTLVSVLFWCGLFAAYSRGPWIGAVAIYFFFALLSPNGIRRVLRATPLFAGILAVISVTPLADRIIRVMPFLGGTLGSGNIEYRQRLFDRSWELIKQSPIFGDQAARLKMQDLRQGEGIIDMINAYMQILLDNGFVGLFLFLSFILVATYKAFLVIRRLARTDPSTAQLGASLVACTLGTLLMIENGGCDDVMIGMLGGLMAAYVCACGSQMIPARTLVAQPRLKVTSNRTSG